MKFKSIVTEIRSCEVEYVVDANDIGEAMELLHKGETVDENQISIEVIDRKLNSQIVEIPED